MIRFGRSTYDHSNALMLFRKPGQIIKMKEVQLEEKDFMLLIHLDYVKDHEMHPNVKQYGFFDYKINEAIHLSPIEETVMNTLYKNIMEEYYNNPDEFSREIILCLVTSILKYAQRYYKRQFTTRKTLSVKILTRFIDMLKSYFNSAALKEMELPTVEDIAEKINLSPQYLSDLLKQETGKTAVELVNISLISEAKKLLLTGENGTGEIAKLSGFENASYFSLLFKKQTGFTPIEFRQLNGN